MIVAALKYYCKLWDNRSGNSLVAESFTFLTNFPDSYKNNFTSLVSQTRKDGFGEIFEINSDSQMLIYFYNIHLVELHRSNLAKEIDREYRNSSELTRNLFTSRDQDLLESYCCYNTDHKLPSNLISTLAMVRTNSLFKPFQYIVKHKGEKQRFQCIYCHQVVNEAIELILHILIYCDHDQLTCIRNFPTLVTNQVLEMFRLESRA